MRSDTDDLRTTEQRSQKQAQNAIRLLGFFILVLTFVSVLEFYLAARLDIWQLLATARSATIFIGVVFGAYLMARSGRPALGIWIFFVSIVTLWVVVTTLFLTGIGFALGLSLVITIPFIASRTLPQRQVFLATIWSYVGIFLGLMGELYGADNRLVIPQLAGVVPVIIVLISLGYGVYVIRQFSAYSIRTKFIVGAIALVLVTGIILTTVISRNTRETIINTTGQRLSSVANAHGLLIGELLARQLNTLQTLSQNQAVQTTVLVANNTYDGSDSEIRQKIDELEATWQTAEFTDSLPQSRLNNLVANELLEFQRHFQSNINVIVTDQFGGLVASTNMVNHYSYSEEPWWQTVYNNGRGANFISPPEIDQETDLFQLTVAVPIYSSDSRTAIGVLHSVYSLRDLTDILFSAQQEFGKTTHLDLFLPPNRLLDFGGDEVEIELPADTLALLEANQTQDFGQFAFEGGESLVSQENVNTLLLVPDIDSLGWVVITHQPLSETLKPVEVQQRTFIIVAIGVLLVGTIGAALFAQILARPLIQLTQAAIQISEGDLSIQARIETQDEMGTLARTFNEMTARLRQTIALQEQRISERTRALEVSSEVSRRLSTILDQQTLVNEMVYQIQVAFNYYHAHIYLFDEKRENLVMVGGTGDAGRKMLESGHSIPKGKGLVGRAAESRMAVLVPDVTEDPDWLPNELLPETVAEAAVPILAGDEVLGVLDVQHNVRFVLKQEDTELLQSIANQVAIAIQNAEAYRRAQKQAQREALINEISQKIQNTTTVDLALKTAVREIGQALLANQTVVKLKNGAGNGQHVESHEKSSE